MPNSGIGANCTKPFTECLRLSFLVDQAVCTWMGYRRLQAGYDAPAQSIRESGFLGQSWNLSCRVQTKHSTRQAPAESGLHFT